MESPNVTWNEFSTQKFQRDVSFYVSPNCVNNEEKTKAQMSTLEQEMKNLRPKPQEH